MTSKKIAIIATSLLLLCMFCCLALPTYIFISGCGYETPSNAWYDALLWLRENTADNDKVLAWWDYGYWIKYVALREPICTPSQESDKVTLVARYLLAYDAPAVPGNAAYIILDKRTAADFTPAIIGWAGYGPEYDTSKSLARRLYFSKTANPVSDYHLVFDNGIKIFKHIHARN